MCSCPTSGKPESGVVATLVGHPSWVLSADISSRRIRIKSIKPWVLPVWRAVPTTHESGGIRGVSRRPKLSASGSNSGAFEGSGDECVRWKNAVFWDCENILSNACDTLLAEGLAWPAPHPSAYSSLVSIFTWPKMQALYGISHFANLFL
ncbi:hypothetical protein EV401DRAFT_1979127 [Pisolithus croceorrhizus]|nr:hypothetical protein EV401DRAFT_1979127 [Pisolithus croceorrhizus]